MPTTSVEERAGGACAAVRYEGPVGLAQLGAAVRERVRRVDKPEMRAKRAHMAEQDQWRSDAACAFISSCCVLAPSPVRSSSKRNRRHLIRLRGMMLPKGQLNAAAYRRHHVGLFGASGTAAQVKRQEPAAQESGGHNAGPSRQSPRSQTSWRQRTK